jgi:hypothetical protein
VKGGGLNRLFLTLLRKAVLLMKVTICGKSNRLLMFPLRNWSGWIYISPYSLSSYGRRYCYLCLNSGSRLLLLFFDLGESRLLEMLSSSSDYGGACESRGMRCPGLEWCSGGRGMMWCGGWERIMGAGRMLLGSISLLRMLTSYDSERFLSSYALS